MSERGGMGGRRNGRRGSGMGWEGLVWLVGGGGGESKVCRNKGVAEGALGFREVEEGTKRNSSH